MIFRRLLTQWFVTDHVAEMAERVAGRSRTAVWQRVMQRVGTLGPIEARGYIRARAIGVVQAETDRLIEQEGDKVGRIREAVVQAALSQLLGLVLGQLEQRRLAAPRRRAA
ncbi:MAG: hypothetical protein SFU86_25750 [Pirellulaceae bacterium]|nr:hypothetical protein [Pirellulaceae bacterium]